MSLHYEKLKKELESANKYVSQALSEVKYGSTLKSELLEAGKSKIASCIDKCTELREDAKKLRTELETLKEKATE